ncbi:MAG: hypothetical protein HY271_16210 [Deltaproteobacteria bacterium]|nr:hypothetical protein [Deltaproteobacteria bacterium]
MTSSASTRIAFTTVLIAATLASPALASPTVVEATAALSFWMTWGLAYLGIAVVLLVVAFAFALREGRAWSALLRWSAAADRAAHDAGNAAEHATAAADDSAERAA